jgi:hypothetical protein
MLMHRRPPTQREEILYYFVQNIGEPSLCDHVSWSAYRTYSALFGGGGSSYWRSDCYEQAAEQRHDAAQCWKVRPLVDFGVISAGYSALSCRRRTMAQYHSGIGLADDVLVGTFEQMGYDIDQMPVEGVFEPAIKLRDVYWSLSRLPSAVARAEQQLTLKSPAIAPDDLNYVADLVAIATSDPKWCAYISVDKTLSQQDALFRDWCYFSVAENTHDARICDRMTPAAMDPKAIAAKSHGVRPEIAEQLSLHGQCDKIKPATGGAMQMSYSAELPSDPQQIRRLIAALGVTMPSAHQWSANQKAIYFQNFVFSLWPDQHDRAHDAARSELVHRLLSIQKDT